MANPPVCYFIVSPNPALIPGGVVVSEPATTQLCSVWFSHEDAIGPHFYIKFGDGEVLPANYRYSTHNPSYKWAGTIYHTLNLSDTLVARHPALMWTVIRCTLYPIPTILVLELADTFKTVF